MFVFVVRLEAQAGDRRVVRVHSQVVKPLHITRLEQLQVTTYSTQWFISHTIVTPADQMSDKSGFDFWGECHLKPDWMILVIFMFVWKLNL